MSTGKDFAPNAIDSSRKNPYNFLQGSTIMSDDFPKKPEQRHYKRIDLELPVRLEMDGRQVESTTQNISCGGMYLANVQEGLQEDGNVVAFITLPESPKVVRLVGRVCRTEKNPEAASHNYAIEFGGLYDDNHMSIDQLIKNKIMH